MTLLETAVTPRAWGWEVARAVVWASVGAVGVGLAAWFFLGEAVEALDVLGYFAPHLILFCGVLSLTALYLAWREGDSGRRGGIYAAAGAAALLGFAAAPLMVLSASPPLLASPAAACAHPLRVVTANLLAINPSPAAAAEALRRIDADILVTQETTGEFWRMAAQLHALYPHRAFRQRQPSGVYGTVLWSKHPLRDRQIETMTATSPMLARATVDLGALPGWTGRTVEAVGLHFGLPVIGDNRAQMLGLGGFIGPRAPGRPRVVLGDFNAAPWGYAMRKAAAGLEAEMIGGFRLTWRGAYPAPGLPNPPDPIGHQIDHVLISDDLHPCSIRTEIIPGSDHRAVVAEIALRLQVAGGG